MDMQDINYKVFFGGKRVLVMGLGLLGRGVGDVEFLAKQGAQVTVTDKKSMEELKESVERLKEYPITFHLGGHVESDFTDTDMVLKAAGVPLDSPYIIAARAANVPVYMSTALFAKFAMEVGVVIVGVTGTRGKSTVVHMIHHVLVQAGKRSHLGGNIRGISTLAMLPEIKKDDIAVLELDSWQLQGFGDLQLSPHVAVFTNLMPDHQNYYPDMESYFDDKANIFRYQTSNDVCVVAEELVEKVEKEQYMGRVCIPEPLPAGWNLPLPGSHNLANAMFAREALHVLGLADDEIRKGVESFASVEGRLQLLKEVNGVSIYNDNNATTPDATVAGLKALDNGSHKIILITGGADKGLDITRLISEMKIHCKNVILLKGTGTDSLKDEFPEAKIHDSLPPAVDDAVASASEGDVILFSPAFASFGMFKNEYDRNDQFLQIVNAL